MFSKVVKPVVSLAVGLGAGVLLAVVSLASHFPTGWVGAGALIAWAVASRRRWYALEAVNGLAPGGPERVLRLQLVGTALVLGHLAAAILLAGNDLRIGHGNSLASDSWMLVAAQMIAGLLFRRDNKEQDERHSGIAARGVRVGYATLIGVLIPVIAWLAFAPRGARQLLSDFIMANVLIALLLVSYAALLIVQLVDYARDTHRVVDDEQLP